VRRKLIGLFGRHRSQRASEEAQYPKLYHALQRLTLYPCKNTNLLTNYVSDKVFCCGKEQAMRVAQLAYCS
jgi:hypothetical protein